MTTLFIILLSFLLGRMTSFIEVRTRLKKMGKEFNRCSPEWGTVRQVWFRFGGSETRWGGFEE